MQDFESGAGGQEFCFERKERSPPEAPSLPDELQSYLLHLISVEPSLARALLAQVSLRHPVL